MSTFKVKTGGVFVEAAGGGGGVPVVYPPPEDPDENPLDSTYGDDFPDDSLDPKWTKRNIAQAETHAGDSQIFVPGGINLTLDAVGDGIWQAAPSGDFEIVVGLAGGWSLAQGQMVGPAVIDSSGAGRGTSIYPDSSGSIWVWTLSSYGYFSSGPSVTGLGLPANNASPYWVALRKSGTNYTARRSLDGTNWSAFTAASSWVGTPDRIGVGRFLAGAGTADLRITRFNIYPGPTFYVP